MNDLFGTPEPRKLRVGEGAARFLSDLADNVPDAEMRRRWVAGDYGVPPNRPRPDYAQAWRKLAGRN